MKTYAGADAAQNNGVVQQTVSGWGRTTPSVARLSRPSNASSVANLVQGATVPLIARGLGRSYGDAAQCSGGLVVETSGLGGIGEIDPTTGSVTVGAGVSLHELMRHAIPRGWFVAVTPGTRYVSVGGAIAADVHGKNHHCDGSFSRFVERLSLATPIGTKELIPAADPELFWATAGGMGLTGIVLDATLRLIPIESSWMRVDSRKHATLEGLMDDMEKADSTHRYSVAWLDCIDHRGGARRSVLTLGEHAPASALPPGLARRRLEALREPILRVPRAAPFRMANRVSVRVLNELWFRMSAAESGSFVLLSSFFHPLDGVAAWNLLYGPQGFVQYQFAVPPDRGDVVEDAVAAIASSGIPSFLAVLKRFGPGTPGPLSFAQEGWTLALDFPVGPSGLPALLDTLDERVADAGGRVYLAKDARLRPELMEVMYPRLGELETLRRRIDPEGVLASDLARRLGMVG